ncbi:starvation-sensing protein RspA [Streptomyces scopuliridis]|uniref:Starvation-sensing protein RspA n=1 Tax=Streptomyces scopuliridis TaxID=452529 RepID=A0ACD4ZC65_9ACTN|nr:enolase C-terminal domain-like protein [Streptomyces scopuliridis]WSB95994.1 starvation-sensing protein RspA [Streptomyces scopuliridis]WSC10299.1 starvation-sensing protein RspA [Streptomyces scopuliridis]
MSHTTDTPTEPPWAQPSGVRITGVRAILTAPAGTTLVVVRVDTNEPGLYGFGCATFTQRAAAVATVVDDYLAPQLIGRDPADITDIAATLHVSGYWRSGPVLNNALSGVDMALWDIKGKQAGLPVWQLLGGRCRTAVPLYAHAAGRDAEEVADEVKDLMSQGYRHVRCQVAVPGAGTYGAPAAAAPGSARPPLTPNAWDPAAYRRTLRGLFEYLRREVGAEVELIHDLHERVHPTDAVRIARDLEPYDLFYLEDPVAPEDIEWLRTIRSHSVTPIAIGELFTNPAEYRPVLQERLCDFIRVHISAIGGITPAWRLAGACELFGVRTAWHGPGDVSPVGHAANLALDLASPNFGIQEQHQFGPAVREVFPGCPEIRDGHLWPSVEPGLGVDFDERLALTYPPGRTAPGHAWKPPRRADGALQRP